MKPQFTRTEIEDLVAFTATHTAEEAVAAFPMFDSETIGHLYTLTAGQRIHLSNYLVERRAFFIMRPQRAVAVPTPVHRDRTDTSDPSASWDMIVRLYEDS